MCGLRFCGNIRLCVVYLNKLRAKGRCKRIIGKREVRFVMDGKVENEGMPVVRLDRQLKYQGNILKIYEDTVLANGHEAHWDYIHHDGAAAVLPVTDDGKILMVRQYRNALNRYTLEIPAGKLDEPDEPKI